MSHSPSYFLPHLRIPTSDTRLSPAMIHPCLLCHFPGLCQMMKLKSKPTPISLSWSESVSSLATNSSTWSILSSSEGDNSITGSSSVMLKRPRQVCCALLSDNPVKEPNPEATDNQEVKQFPLFWRFFMLF